MFAGLPDGLDTAVGEHRGSASGGERRRIGVARALLADRPIMVSVEHDACRAPDTAPEVLDLAFVHAPERAMGLLAVRTWNRPQVDREAFLPGRETDGRAREP